jgi:hypothetical protein
MEYSTNSPNSQPRCVKFSGEQKSADDELLDLDLEALNGSEAEVDAEVIEALTSGEEAIKSEERARAAQEAHEKRMRPLMEICAKWVASKPPGYFDDPVEHEQQTPAPPPPKPHIEYTRPAMADATDEDIERAIHGDPRWRSSTQPEPEPEPARDDAPSGEPERPIMPQASPERIRELREQIRGERESRQPKYTRVTDAKFSADHKTEIAHKREQSAARSRKYRARKRTVAEKTATEILKELEAAPFPDPMPWRSHRAYKKRLRSLCEATANPKADGFLVQMRGREIEIVDAWVIVLDARKKHGAKASLTQIAWHHPDKGMTKHRVRRMLENIAKLEQPGQPWAA